MVDKGYYIKQRQNVAIREAIGNQSVEKMPQLTNGCVLQTSQQISPEKS